MPEHIIKNFEQLAFNEQRRKALEIVEAGLSAINTSKVVHESISLQGDILKIKDKEINLTDYKEIHVVGVGKASCDAILALDEILKDKVTSGIAIDVKSASCENPNIKFYKGFHPKPTPENVIATQEIMNLAKDVTSDDIILCVISGGGSALLCTSDEECDVSNLIYDNFLQAGGNINELNTLRKHTSTLKGGGLAKLFYPATVIGLIFSDIPGGQIENVASGPTFLDASTLSDVSKIVEKYNLEFAKNMKFTETLKEQKYFEKVSNLLLVSNHTAIEGMQAKALELGLETEIYSEITTETIEKLAKYINTDVKTNTIRLVGGEPAVISYAGTFGKGGRCTQLALESAPYLKQNSIFVAFASDGIDNSDADGAIVDSTTMSRITAKFDYEKQKLNLDSYPVFESLDDLIITGITGSNVSDLFFSVNF